MVNLPNRFPLPDPDLKTLLELVKSEIRRELNCVSVGEVVSFDEDTQLAEIKIVYRKVIRRRGKSSKEVTIDYPLLIKVPIVVLTGGNSYLTFPIAAGDSCLLFFCDRDLDRWLINGQEKQPPSSERMHDLSDAIALVGVRNSKNLISGYSVSKVQLYSDLEVSVKDKHDERLVPPGTGPVPTFCSTAPSGWIFMYGQTIGNADSGANHAGAQYEDLFNILKDVDPNTGSEDFDSDDTVIVPDMRGRTPVGLDNMGGSSADVITDSEADTLGGEYGEEEHLLTHEESGVPAHNHPQHPSTIIELAGNRKGGTAFGTLGGTTQDNTPEDASESHNNVQPSKFVNYMIKY